MTIALVYDGTQLYAGSQTYDGAFGPIPSPTPGNRMGYYGGVFGLGFGIGYYNPNGPTPPPGPVDRGVVSIGGGSRR